MNSTKHISQIILPSLDSQVTDSNENSTSTDLDYLTELKSRTDKLAENWKGEFGVKESYLARLKIVRQAKQELRDDILPTKEELDYCFPGCEHPEARQEPPAPQKPEPTHPPTRQQVEQRLNNPAQSKDDSDKPKLSKKDWEWIEKANHPLGGRLFYGGGVTPQFMELDLKLGISDSPHRRRLLDYLGIHCDLKKGITSEVTVGELSDKLQCGKDKIRESIKWLVKKEVLEYSNGYAYPKHYTTGVVFVLPFVRESHEVKAKANGLRTKTGIPYRELWERREEFGFGVKCEVNAKA